jgi:hypothetical protein
MDAIQKVQKARARDREVIRKHGAQRILQKGQMSFLKFLVNRETDNLKPGRGKLRETLNSFEYIKKSLFAAIPAQASDREITLAALIDEFRRMTDTMDIFLTVIGIEPEVSSSVR